jgi:hypothetical protein
MKKILTILLVLFFALFITGIVFAENAKDDTKNNVVAPLEEKPVKNITYGKCVSENAVLKNDCYSSVKDALASCKMQANNQTDAKKDALKACKTTYKTDKKQCKTTFKDAKKECKKIKHNFFETIGSSLK